MDDEEKLNLDLVGVDGNAFSILGFFRKEAKKAGWNKDKIDEVCKEATSGDYNHLVTTIIEQ